MKYFVIIFLIFGCINVFGQAKKKTLSPIKPPNLNSDGFGRVSNLSLTARIKNYPFNKAAQVQLVSFEDPTGGGQLDTTKIVYNKNMPKSHSAVCINPFKEIKALNFVQMDKLTDILFNYGPLGQNHIGEIGKCYNPKNAILFLDENGKVFDFIEICFHCLHMYSFSKKLDVEYKCDHTINMIREFFRETGIKYGVIKD